MRYDALRTNAGGRRRDGLQGEAAVDGALDHHEAPAGDAPRGDDGRWAMLCGSHMLILCSGVRPYHP